MSLPTCPLCGTIPCFITTPGGYQRVMCGSIDCLIGHSYSDMQRAEQAWTTLCSKVNRVQYFQGGGYSPNQFPFPVLNIPVDNKKPLPVDQTGEGEATKDDIFGEL